MSSKTVMNVMLAFYMAIFFGFSGVVDIPNSCATVYIPTEIFDFNVKPGANGPQHKVKQGIKVPMSKN